MLLPPLPDDHVADVEVAHFTVPAFVLPGIETDLVRRRPSGTVDGVGVLKLLDKVQCFGLF